MHHDPLKFVDDETELLECDSDYLTSEEDKAFAKLMSEINPMDCSRRLPEHEVVTGDESAADGAAASSDQWEIIRCPPPAENAEDQLTSEGFLKLYLNGELVGEAVNAGTWL